MRILFSLILLMFFFNCKKDTRPNQINIGITYDDTLNRVATSTLDSRYRLFGENDDTSELILSPKTNSKMIGDYKFGFLESAKPQNKCFVFLTDYKKRIDSLPNIENPEIYILVDEFELSTNELVDKYLLIDKEFDISGKYDSQRLIFAFVDNDSDTIGYQYTTHSVIKNKVCSISFLTESKAEYVMMHNKIAEFGKDILK